MTAQRLLAPAPFFSLACAAWIPYAWTWDPETGAFRSVKGTRGFATYREAEDASRFLRADATSLEQAYLAGLRDPNRHDQQVCEADAVGHGKK